MVGQKLLPLFSCKLVLKFMRVYALGLTYDGRYPVYYLRDFSENFTARPDACLPLITINTFTLEFIMDLCFNKLWRCSKYKNNIWWILSGDRIFARWIPSIGRIQINHFITFGFIECRKVGIRRCRVFLVKWFIKMTSQTDSLRMNIRLFSTIMEQAGSPVRLKISQKGK